MLNNNFVLYTFKVNLYYIYRCFFKIKLSIFEELFSNSTDLGIF